MKLRNKKTGEIVLFGEGIVDLRKIGCANVAEMIETGWEDYEEKEYFYLDMDGDIRHTINQSMVEYSKEIGNCFSTKYDAEKALDRLKAWKFLKDNGITFSLDENNGEPYIKIHSKDETGSLEKIIKIYNDLDLLFGGE